MDNAKVAAILLAAGESRRMGRHNKLLLDYRGNPLVRHVATELLTANISECFVITGYQTRQVSEALKDMDVRIVMNEDYYSGMCSGIKKGIDQLSANSDGCLICLADMPLLRGMHYNALIQKFRKEKETDKPVIIRPTYKEMLGHPVLFDRHFFPEVMKCTDPKGALNILSKNPEYVINYPLGNEAYYTDMDTEMDYYKLR